MAPLSEIPPPVVPVENALPRLPDSKTSGWDANALKGNPHGRTDKAERVREMFTAIAHAYDINNRVHSLARSVVAKASGSTGRSSSRCDGA